MEQGKAYAWLVDDKDPAKSANTDLVFAWYSMGGKLAPRAFEKFEEDGKPRITWVVEVSTPADINGDVVMFDEFKRRWEDLEWCKANEWHPIAIMRAFRDNSRDGKRWAREQATGIAKTKGNSRIVVYPNSPEWLKKEFARFI
jgi:hypothetical protein